MTGLTKTALVTGGTRGIGREIVKKLAGLGYQVYFTFVSRPELAEEVRSLVAAEGGTACGFLLDASDWDAVAQFFLTTSRTRSVWTSWSTTPASPRTVCWSA